MRVRTGQARFLVVSPAIVITASGVADGQGAAPEGASGRETTAPATRGSRSAARDAQPSPAAGETGPADTYQNYSRGTGVTIERLPRPGDRWEADVPASEDFGPRPDVTIDTVRPEQPDLPEPDSNILRGNTARAATERSRVEFPGRRPEVEAQPLSSGSPR